MRKRHQWVIGFACCIAVVATGWSATDIVDQVLHVNEPRITSAHLAKVQKDFASLIPANAKDVRVLWVELDAGTTVFEYSSPDSLEYLLDKASTSWKATEKHGNYATVISDAQWLLFGQIWRLDNRTVVAVSSKQTMVTDASTQAKIQKHAGLCKSS